MHELLTAAAAATPVPGNAHGSYVTMRSKNGLIFGVINVIGNFATVFQDQVRVHKLLNEPQSLTNSINRHTGNVQLPANPRALSRHICLVVWHGKHLVKAEFAYIKSDFNETGSLSLSHWPLLSVWQPLLCEETLP